MAKTNFTKVEEALAEGMRKIEVNKLLKAADDNSEKPAVSETKKIDPILLRRLTKIDQELQLLQKEGKNPYAQLQIDQEEIKRFLKDPTLLTDQDWEKIKELKQKIANFKAAWEGKEDNSEDDFIEQQRKDQKSKRFNINKKWIPLQ
jgi:hypothetical protein